MEFFSVKYPHRESWVQWFLTVCAWNDNSAQKNMIQQLSKLRVTYLPYEFSMYFSDAVYRSWSLYGEVRGWVSGGVGTKRSCNIE